MQQAESGTFSDSSNIPPIVRHEMKKRLNVLKIVIAVTVVAVVGWFMFHHTGMTARDRSQYNNAAHTGVPIVEAIYEYRNATELYPETISDLSRVSTIAVDTNRWAYEWRNDFARLEFTGSEVPYGLSYSFSDQHSGWSVGNRVYRSMTVDAPVHIQPRPERSEDVGYRLIVEEIERRIKSRPDKCGPLSRAHLTLHPSGRSRKCSFVRDSDART